MKKQILILTFIVAAILAGTSTAFAQDTTAVNQAVTGTTPIDPLSCVAGSEPLHPYAGVSYTYSMQDTGAQAVDLWTWYATKDQTFIDSLTGNLNVDDSLRLSTGDLLGYSSNYGTATAAAESVDITWSSQILSQTSYQGADGTNTPTFVVAHGTGVNCSDNIQVYEINPRLNFTLDIANIHPTADTTMAWDAVVESCVSPVYSAIYNTSTYELDVDYGHDTLYFEIAAANFVKNFQLTFQLISGLETNQEATLELYASKALAQAGGSPIETWNWDSGDIGATETPNEFFEAANAADVTLGVSVFLKVIISNNQYESLADNPFEIAVDAIDNDANGIWDMEDDDCPADPPTATDAADQVDRATHIITPRPRIDHNTTDGGAPNPTTIIPKPNTTTGAGNGF